MSEDTTTTTSSDDEDQQPPTESSVISQPATVEACQRDYAGGAAARRGFDKAAKRKRKRGH